MSGRVKKEEKTGSKSARRKVRGMSHLRDDIHLREGFLLISKRYSDRSDRNNN